MSDDDTVSMADVCHEDDVVDSAGQELSHTKVVTVCDGN